MLYDLRKVSEIAGRAALNLTAHIQKKNSRPVGKRPVADVLIEAFAQRFQGLITRNPKHFTRVPVIVPSLLPAR